MEKRRKHKKEIGRVTRKRGPQPHAAAGVSHGGMGAASTAGVLAGRDPKDIFLTVDIGNTTIHFAVFQSGVVICRQTLATVQKTSELVAELKKVLIVLHRCYSSLNRIVICSVVPSVTNVLETIIAKNLKTKIVVVGRDIIVPIKNLYNNPKQVGQDRLVCAFAACELYGQPAIVIDLGTAITLDVVSAQREYLGGIIVPGIHITAETLFERTALLPLVEITKPKALIGKDTQGSILSGIFYGYGEMLKGLIKLLSHDSKIKPKVIITGGHAKLMVEYVKDSVDVIDPDLVLKGLALLAR